MSDASGHGIENLDHPLVKDQGHIRHARVIVPANSLRDRG